MIRIEKLMGLFGLKGIRYSSMPKGGRGPISVEEQLGAIGLAWHDAPAGFLLLMSEFNDDRTAQEALEHLAFMAVAHLMKENRWRGNCPLLAIKALCVTAIFLAQHQRGHLCPECEGTGHYIRKREARRCQACDDGHIAWTAETIYAELNKHWPMTPKRFLDYEPYLETLTDWLAGQRLAAILTMDEKLANEQCDVHRLAA